MNLSFGQIRTSQNPGGNIAQCYYILASPLEWDAETKAFDDVRMRLYTCAHTVT